MRFSMKKIIMVLVVLFFPVFCFALDGKVVGVSDGDTVTVLSIDKQQIKVRLYGVDCPEKAQDYGQKAKQFTSDLVFGKIVDLEKVDQDRYGRTVGIVKAGGKVLNEELLKNGFAWQYSQYCKRPECSQWKQYEEQARSSKAGLWAGKDPIAPWSFRHGDKAGQKESQTQVSSSTSASSSAGNGQFHGNINSHIFHAPGCKNYDCKNCTESFSSRDEALKAGYKPCSGCLF